MTRAICLRAKHHLTPGVPLTLSYGHRPLRDMLRGYGFVPSDCYFEVIF